MVQDREQGPLFLEVLACWHRESYPPYREPFEIYMIPTLILHVRQFNHTEVKELTQAIWLLGDRPRIHTWV